MQSFEKKKRRKWTQYIFTFRFNVVQKENNYSVASGGEITCARLGFENYQILAAGDD